MHFHGEHRSNTAHRSTTEPESRLYKQTRGSEAKPCYLRHGLMRNRNGLLVKTHLALAEGRAECEAMLPMVTEMRSSKHLILAADKNYDTEDFVRRLRQMRITSHVVQKMTNRSSAVDRRPTRHAGYALSLQKRKCVEQCFG